jgi:hypothetical protein
MYLPITNHTPLPVNGAPDDAAMLRLALTDHFDVNYTPFLPSPIIAMLTILPSCPHRSYCDVNYTPFLQLINTLVSNGADITATYRLPDGRSTGITALHAVLMLSDPTDYIKKYFNPQEVQMLQVRKCALTAIVQYRYIFCR